MIFVMIIIIIAVLVTIGYPLIRFRAYKGFAPDDTGDYKYELIRKKESSYEAIKELDFDYNTGKLSDEDYQNLYKTYKFEALKAIREMDKETLTEMESIDAEVETEIQEMRSGLYSSSDNQHVPAAGTCPACGAEYDKGDSFCKTCGAQLGKKCGACGSLNLDSAKFCYSCGERL